MKKIIFTLAFCFFSFVIYSQNTEKPGWVNRSVFIENGIVYFVGSSSTLSQSMALQRAQLNAQSNLFESILNNVLTEYPTIPVDAKNRSRFSHSYNNVSVNGTISDITTEGVWVDNNGRTFALFSCSGIELAQ